MGHGHKHNACLSPCLIGKPGTETQPSGGLGFLISASAGRSREGSMKEDSFLRQHFKYYQVQAPLVRQGGEA